MSPQSTTADPRANNTELATPRRPRPTSVLPREARDLLVSASQVASPHERRVAIDAAIDYVKLRFPDSFHPAPAQE